jgi:predicted ATPase
LEISLGSLNVFSGLNGMGKSTVIQSLLMLKQSFQQEYFPDSVALNGDFVNLGTGRDVLFENANNEEIKISISEKEKNFSICIGYESKADVLKIKNMQNNGNSLFEAPFEYLNAERTAPQVIYPKSSYFIESKVQLGVNGQFTAHYLSKYQDATLVWNSCDRKENFLKGAVQYWLNEISPNVKIDVQEIENTDLAKIGYYYTDNEKSNTFRPTNVGFGISYVLPIIIALLKATPNSILIIENPEAHLHPRGQRKIGELIARCAATGVQIFVETHSDHILNGIRIVVKNSIISNKKVALFYFSKEQFNRDVVHTVETPKLNENGKLDYWPDGFFDEWEKALDEII